MSAKPSYVAWLITLAILALSPGSARAETDVQFNRDIRPILSDKCFVCHGFDEANREADLRLDTFDDATESAIVPGKASESELVRRLLTSDADEIMPPPETEKQLSRDEIDLIRRWINQGAQYEEHWAWQPLIRPKTDATGRNAIDQFLESGWKENQASPAKIATPRERLRRLSFDLRGLPPTPDDVETFEADPTQERFLAFRDTWMKELAYAEHQAVRWLDLVRWADTSGFVSDEPIASGAYRAWIIDAYHENMPFDQFSIEQLAGDLLPNPTDGQLVASGYNRIVNTNCEAGAIEAEQLYKLKGEHVRAVGTVWMGLTTGCAECHDHKFDPFSAKDYYSLAAFFDDLVETGVYTPGDRREPLHYVHDQKDASVRDRELAKSIRQLRYQIAAKPTDDLPSWEKETLAKLKDTKSRTDFVWLAANPPGARIVQGDFEFVELDGRPARQTIVGEKQFQRHHIAELMTGYLTANSQKTDDEKDAWFVDVWIDPDNRPDMIGFQVSNGRYGRLGWKDASYETYLWGTDTSGVLEKPNVWSAPKRTKRIGDFPKQSGWVRLRVPFKELIKKVGGTYEAVGIAFLQSGGRVGWGDTGLELRTDKTTSLSLGETAVRKWWETPHNRQFYQVRAEYVAKAIRKSAKDRDDLQNEMVADAFRENTQPDLMTRLRQLESELGVLRGPAMPVLVSRKADQKKQTRLLHRGDYQDTTGPIVSAAIPDFLNAGQSTNGSSRLDLAKWLFAKDNPMTARVFVNRLWHQFYGRGISETLEDSGTQGDWPSHLGLLDWLAAEFRDSGWDRDHMVRLLTSTRAYQLSSTPSADLAKRDPGNRWHARQGRYRLTAESIRDTSLGVAGLLKTTSQIPRESFFPYQPTPYWTRSDKVMYGSRHMIWETSPDASQYQRSLYTFWKRQNIHPTMLAFDAPTRQECTAKRNITNTPGQALALLNDPIFVEAARVFAKRTVDVSSDDDERINHAFRVALQRKPLEDERIVLRKLLESQRSHYKANPADAQELVSTGQAATPTEDVEEIAAWTAVTRAILNLHEFLNRS